MHAPIEIADFDPLYLENHFEFLKVVKKTSSLVKDLQNKVNFTKSVHSRSLNKKNHVHT